MLRLVVVVVVFECLAAQDTSVSLSKDPASSDKDAVPDTLYDVREKARLIREEAQQMRSDAYDTMSKAFQVKEEALASREEAMEERAELQLSIVETLSLLRGQATATSLYLQEIRNTLNSVTGRIGEVEGKVDSLGERLAALEGAMEVSVEKSNTVQEMVESNGDLITGVRSEVQANRLMTASIKSRQEVLMSEVRLISLYKMTDQSTMNLGGGGGHGSDLAVDGQFVYSHWAPDTPVRTITHTLNTADQKLWIDLGGLFRIHRVKIWNARHCGTPWPCRDRFVGTHVYAGERLLGVATSGEFIYDYKVAEDDATYARSVTLHQVRAMYLHVSEVQVWGTGPFSEDDKFA